MTKRLNTIESISKWITGINSIELDKRNLAPTTEHECARCQMLEMEISRLKWLIANMMEPTENIKEFDCEQIQ